MKCPKCDYLGFETGDRCKNCGYDFSLSPVVTERDLRLDATFQRTLDTSLDPTLDPTLDSSLNPTPSMKYWLDQLDVALAAPAAGADRDIDLSPPVVPAAARAAAPPPPVRAAVKLPLFRPPTDDDDEPLIKLPAAPRPPLAVRKTPDMPRLRAVPRPVPRSDEPVLQFADEGGPDPELRLRDEAAPVTPAPRRAALDDRANGVSGAGLRLGAAAIDHAILFAIDAAVIYLTMRMAALPFDQWSLLPAAPLLSFLLLVKFAYFCAFTAVGGQTIGKMALSIRVVSDGDVGIDASCAVRRTLAGFASLVFGLGFIPALFDSERRALHDRIAHTRVVALRPA